MTDIEDIKKIDIESLIGGLPMISKRDKEIISRRYGFSHPDGCKETFDSLAKAYGITRERVRQIIKRVERYAKRAVYEMESVEP